MKQPYSYKRALGWAAGGIAAGLIVSASFGAFMAFRNWYYTARAGEDAAQDAKRQKPPVSGL